MAKNGKPNARNTNVNKSEYCSYTDGELVSIISKSRRHLLSESKTWLEFKQAFSGDTEAWVKLLAELVSLANTNGGILIIGIDDTGKPVGVSESLLKTLDPAKINDKLGKYTTARIDASPRIVTYYKKAYLAICVSPSPSLIVFDRDGNYQKDNKSESGFRAGIVYVRKPGGKCPAQQTDLESKVREITQRNTSSFLARIKHVASVPSEAGLIAVEAGNPERGYQIREDGTAIPVVVSYSDEKALPISRAVALTRERRVPVINPGKLKPSEVVKLVQKRLGSSKIFRMNEHTQAWKYYGVRPASNANDPADCNLDYCNYDDAHKDYLYTQKWVDFLSVKLSNEIEYKAVVRYKGS